MKVNSTVLITGGTGSFGKKFTEMTLKKYKPKKIIIFSRDEMKQWYMNKAFGDLKNLRFFIGDVRDKDRLMRALDGVDYIVHAAATKIVPTAEYNPFECVKTNILGAMNVIDCAIDRNIKSVIALSTDKASAPINLYGATKLTSDKLFIAANSYSGIHKTKFSIVRYGNVMGSRGSIIPYFIQLAENSKDITLTDKRMTRFMLPLNEAINMVWKAFDDMTGGEIYVKKSPSMKVTDIIKACAPDSNIKVIGIRPGEKLHEQMISAEDSPFTYGYPDYFKILPSIHNWHLDKKRIKRGIRVHEGFIYDSKSNKERMTITHLKKWIKFNKNNIGSF